MRRLWSVISGVVLVSSLSAGVTLDGTAAAAATPGVSGTTIRVGIPYVDLSSLKALGIKLDQGNFAHAYQALIANLNAHGGIDGRKLAPYVVAVNPTGTAAAASACTQLTEDDQVFAAIAPLQPDCYLQAGTPTIQGNTSYQSVYGTTPNFTLTAPVTAYDPLQLSVFSKMGLFKNKKVGLFAGGPTDEAELKVVQSNLKKLHVDVVQSAVDSAPATDQAAFYQQIALITQRFQSTGVTEVVAVGTGSSSWPTGLAANQSTYHPPWIATDATAIEGSILGKPLPAVYMKNMVASSPTPSTYQQWQDPAVKQCVAIVRKAYPGDRITPPTNPPSGSNQTFVAAESACQDMAVFTTIAKGAGKNLTISTFTRAGYGLHNVTFPGSGGPVSFGPGQAYAIGPVFLVTYDAKANALQTSTKSQTK